MESVIVAIDSFDSPNEAIVKPKRFVANVQRSAFGFSNQRFRNQDKRSSSNQDEYRIYNGELEDVQLLLLSNQRPSGLTLDAVQNINFFSKDVVNNQENRVNINLAKKRRNGYFQRFNVVNQKFSGNADQLDIIWVSKKTSRSYTMEEEPIIYTNANIVRRAEFDVKDTYKETSNKRPLYIPSGVNVSDISVDAFVDTDVETRKASAKTMYAVGCTCRDMLFRGAVEARYGCKHMIAWEKARDEGRWH